MVTPTKPRELERCGQRGAAVLAGRPRLAGARRARHPLAVQGHRPPARRHRKLCDDRKPLARPRDRGAGAPTREGMPDGGPAKFSCALIVIGLPVILLMIIANRFFKFREKKLEVEALPSPPRRPRNMRRARMSWSSACACSSRSSPTAARKPPRRSRRCAAQPARAEASELGRLNARRTRHDIERGTSMNIRKLDLGADPARAIGIAPFKMWLRIKEKQIEPRPTSPPRRAPNMPSTWSGSKRGFASRADRHRQRRRRPPRRSRRCATRHAFPRGQPMNPFEFVSHPVLT